MLVDNEYINAYNAKQESIKRVFNNSSPSWRTTEKSLENAVFYRDSRLFVLLKSSFVFFSNHK